MHAYYTELHNQSILYRKQLIPEPTLVSKCPWGNEKIVNIACCRGQPNPKNDMRGKYLAGQEGPRTHVVTEDGKLYIAGTCHKGLGGDHFYKIMNPSQDHLTFYQVGGKARDDIDVNPCLTGALESILTSEGGNMR